MSEPLLAEVATLASGRPSGHAVQFMRVWLGQNKIDLATWVGYSRKDVERWEIYNAAVPTDAWDKLVEMVNRRLTEITKKRGAK